MLKVCSIQFSTDVLDTKKHNFAKKTWTSQARSLVSKDNSHTNPLKKIFITPHNRETVDHVIRGRLLTSQQPYRKKKEVQETIWE